MKIQAKQIRGFWDRGSVDECPAGFFPTFQNLMVANGYLEPRPGFPRIGTANWSRPGYTKVSVYKPNPVAGVVNNSTIVQGNSGGRKIWNLTNDPINPIYVPTVDFHSWINFFGRGYFGCHDGAVGGSENVQVYEGGATSRNAAGTKPVSFMGIAIGAAAGNLSAGTYLVDVCFITASGFITKPSGTVLSVNVPANSTIDLTFVPLGPAGTVGRFIIMTKVIPLGTYTGNPDDYEFFFEPNGRINDNVTLLHTINTFDGDLIDSADYLYDQLETIPAGCGIGNYNGRLLTWGAGADPSVIRISRIANPESIDAIGGLITVDPSESGGVRTCIILRNNLYILKASKWYVTTDNGGEPSTWKIDDFDGGLGTESSSGVAQVIDRKGANLNQFIVACASGLVLFDGIIRTPELTYNIEQFWRDLDIGSATRTEVVLDPIHRLIYCKVHVAGAADGQLLVGDYTDGMDAEHIKWYLWKITSTSGTGITAICMILFGSTNIPLMMVASDLYFNSFNFRIPQLTDGPGDTISPIILQTPALFFDGNLGNMQAITHVKIRQTGGLSTEITVGGVSGKNGGFAGTLKTMPFVNDFTLQTKSIWLPFVDDMPQVELRMQAANRSKIAYMEVDGYTYGEAGEI